MYFFCIHYLIPKCFMPHDGIDMYMSTHIYIHVVMVLELRKSQEVAKCNINRM